MLTENYTFVIVNFVDFFILDSLDFKYLCSVTIV